MERRHRSHVDGRGACSALETWVALCHVTLTIENFADRFKHLFERVVGPVGLLSTDSEICQSLMIHSFMTRLECLYECPCVRSKMV